jgi:hypothetical protein
MILRTIFSFILLIPVLAFGADSFTPGAAWKDTAGANINAHGCCVVWHDGAYYWFGETRSGSKWAGIRCYKSTDLYNWQPLGYALSPSGSRREDMQDISDGRLLERPKIVYNPNTGKWILYAHWENGSGYGEARVCVAVADQVQGPYSFVKTFQPNGKSSRDQTLFADGDVAYHVSNTAFTDMHIIRLKSDFLSEDSINGQPTETIVFKGKKFEAFAIFRAGDTYHGLFSLSDGWNPTPGQTGYAFDMLGEWMQGGNFAIDSGQNQSYQSQSAYVLKVHGKENAYIYMGDRWAPGNVESSTYVWLPLSMRSGYPAVRWRDTWNLSVFDDADRYKRAAEIVSGNVYSLLERASDRLVAAKATGGFAISDSQAKRFVIVQTETPWVYRLKDPDTGKFLQNVFGSLQWRDGDYSSDDSQMQDWYFDLQEDGYYKIKNMGDYRLSYLSVSGNATLEMSNIYLSEKESDARYFSVYFDSQSEYYEAADIFSKSYRDENRRKIDEHNQLSEIIPLKGNDPVVDVQYYNLLGMRLSTVESGHDASPHPAVHIMKQLLRSGQVITTKHL